jgi:D-alanyl-lipoteichoic acid acyltransferase DltB (MBOAT superfamily)
VLFNSPAFVLFFSIVTAGYFLLPHRFRWTLLLSASCFFYMYFKPIYILILFFTIVVDYFAGIAIENASGATRKRYLVVSIVANVGVLFVFKYFNFFASNLTALAGRPLIPLLAIALTIGLSFHTFQAMSYTIEVYRGNQRAERHFGLYALYVMFYPQLVAGPIERPQNLLHQFREPHRFDYERAVDGLTMMAWGMFKKVVIADHLARYVNTVYGDPSHHSGLPALVAIYFFSFQIYCDFSGYSDIALGSAKVMGFDLMQNFRSPYLSASLSEFWTRWHISLSTWFKDYLYIPLGGNRVGKFRWQLNLLIVFLVSGLWHGAEWTFVIWGAIHGLCLIAGIQIGRGWHALTRGLGPSLQRFLGVVITFHLVSFAWVFFRCHTTAEALEVLRSAAHLGANQSILLDGFSRSDLVVCFAGIALLTLVSVVPDPASPRVFPAQRAWWVRWPVYYALVVGCLLLGEFNYPEEFIYFRF